MYVQFPGLSSLLELFTPNTFSKVFYEILFPPVIFNAGFTLKQRHFMKNIGSISTYAVIGTFVSCIILSLSIYGINKGANFAPLDFIECVMFGALLSATDAVSTIAVLLVCFSCHCFHVLVFVVIRLFFFFFFFFLHNRNSMWFHFCTVLCSVRVC